MPDYIVLQGGGLSEEFSAADAYAAYDHAATLDDAGDLYVKVGARDDAITEDLAARPGSHPVAVQLIVHPLTDGYRVQINSYAETCAERLEVALAMALPYVRDVAQPDPLMELFRRPSAPGSAPDMGGTDA